MHKIIEFCVTSSLALDNRYIVKLLAISQTINTVCCKDDYFQKGNLNYLIVCFNQCTLFFPKRFFSLLVICFPCVICGSYETKVNADTARGRHSRRLACLRSHVLRAYCNFESKQANSITPFGGSQIIIS